MDDETKVRAQNWLTNLRRGAEIAARDGYGWLAVCAANDPARADVAKILAGAGKRVREMDGMLCLQIGAGDRVCVRVETYAEKRAREYPPIADQLDALAKMAVWLRAHGVAIGPDANAWVDTCEAVKARYPKDTA